MSATYTCIDAVTHPVGWGRAGIAVSDLRVTTDFDQFEPEVASAWSRRRLSGQSAVVSLSAPGSDLFLPWRLAWLGGPGYTVGAPLSRGCTGVEFSVPMCSRLDANYKLAQVGLPHPLALDHPGSVLYLPLVVTRQHLQLTSPW